MQYCIYLRKSRKDMDAEAHGEGETLARHERLLLEVAKRGEYNVTQIYREVVSGDTIASRPVMQRLLQEVEEGMWSGVLVVEIERLARGDTIDQGIMAQTFKYSGTKIITPMKVYDPENEFDEEYFEFGLFMSRREYKTINRRLQRGRLASAKEGKYLAPTAPYGYEKIRIKNDKGFTLKPVEETAAVVRLIFELYVNGEVQPDGYSKTLGTTSIAIRLDDMKITPPNGSFPWSNSTIRRILANPVYIGKILWKKSKTVKKIENGVVKKTKVLAQKGEQVLVDGLHEAIVSDDLFYAAQEILRRKGPCPVPINDRVVNPLAGLIVCAKCGRKMGMKRNRNSISCPNRTCDNISSYYQVVEDKLLKELSDLLGNYRLNYASSGGDNDESLLEVKKKAMKSVTQELQTLKKQLLRTHDLLEQGVYDTDTFLSRSRSLTERISSAEESLDKLSAELVDEATRLESQKDIIPKVEKLLEVFRDLPDPKSKNDVLKAVLEKVVYLKTERAVKDRPLDCFELTIFPKLPLK